MTATLVPVTVRLPNGLRTFRVTPTDRLVGLRLYRWQTYEGRTGRRLPRGDPEGDRRRRLARGHAALWFATHHMGIPPSVPVDDPTPTR